MSSNERHSLKCTNLCGRVSQEEPKIKIIAGVSPVYFSSRNFNCLVLWACKTTNPRLLSIMFRNDESIVDETLVKSML